MLEHILKHGINKHDRTQTGTVSIFGYQMRFDLNLGFPLLTTKKLHIRSIVYELLWFLSGDTNVAYLQQHGVKIWNDWADATGALGPIYGRQWRHWPTNDGQHIDQLTNLLQEIKCNPDSRRLVVSAWNVGELSNMALMPCHVLFQFYVANGSLSCQLYQRSADVFLGVPFNIASYALLAYLIAHQCNLTAHELIWTGGDCHLYNNHLTQVHTQLTREPLPLPQLMIHHKPDSLFDYRYEDITFSDYQAHPTIQAPIAV